MKYLFSAEINQIQKSLFAGDRQRQVVGGSRLLAELGQAAGQLAMNEFGVAQEDVLVTDGGNFAIIFADEGKARHFGELLQTAVHLGIDAPMTIATPQPITNATDFSHLYRSTKQEIAAQKTGGRSERASNHAPTTAFCQASGEGLAAEYSKFNNNNEDPRYIARSVQQMGQAGFLAKKGEEEAGQENDDDNSFLGLIHKEIKGYDHWNWAPNPEFLAELDPLRSNIAYLVADGNNLGKLFDNCTTQEELREFSRHFTRITRRALAKPITQLVERLRNYEGNTFPLLPLIVAGDDIFVMLPAPYALDFAQQFCLTYEQEMRESEIVQKLRANETLPEPTMSAAIVFCKRNYPYGLAHQRGEELLKETKQLVKQVGRTENNQWHSAVSFDFILGSERLGKTHQTDKYRAGFTTYWVIDQERNEEPSLPLSSETITLQTLLNQRQKDYLGRLPNKRLAEVRQLFDVAELPHSDPDCVQRWNPKLEKICRRIDTTNSPAVTAVLINALNKLGLETATPTTNLGRWRSVSRGGKKYRTQGIADLLRVWPYAQLLDCPLSDYQQERES